MTGIQAEQPRFAALDVLRGIAIAGMILVNTPGSWSYVYAPLRHAAWHGFTPTDLVFPLFLFITGAAMSFSFREQSAAARRRYLPRIAKRVAILFALGVFLNWFGYWPDFSDLRIMGVLQRIALAYGAAALIVLYCARLPRLLIGAGLLLGYWGLLQFADGDPYALSSNIVRQIDLAVLGAPHMWAFDGIPFDPEGILSTIPAIASVLIGYEFALLLRPSDRAPSQARRVAIGIALVVAGLAWNPWLPINKPLWTGSYALYSSGICILMLLALAALMKLPFVAKLLQPLRIYGENPLFIYALSWLFAASLAALIRLPGPDGTPVSAYEWGFLQFGRFLSPLNASLAFALLMVLIFYVVAWLLHRRKIIIRL